ncbi:unnamed protein product [Linum trigynum]|uniref:F-box domain-containing protein n=1 Tax=Linum trigynum TaxID=586398 RepID=A0AAV2EP57_9ROSI
MAPRNLRFLPCSSSSSSAWELHRVPNPPSPSSSISKLGGDLLLEVVIRVPDPRSAFRCKLVCKRWNSLISDPYFNRRFVSHHQRMNEGYPSLLIRSRDRESVILSFLPLPCCFSKAPFRVFDCFKDLVLCGMWVCDPGMGRSWFVCNPFTKQWVALPLMPKRSRKERAGMVARLVCEPRSNPELDLGDGQVFVHSEYRFRVVCMYKEGGGGDGMSTKLDVFCSESGAWTEGAFVLDSKYSTYLDQVVSCNGRFFCYASESAAIPPILGIDPFRLDRPPYRVDNHPGFSWEHFDISISQGVLHIARLAHNSAAPPLLTVWRQEEDDDHQHISWSEVYQVSLKEPSKPCNYSRERCYFACLHPDDPEIVFLYNDFDVILYHDVRTGEEGVFDDEYSHPWRLFQPRISCWPTPIPNYEKLRAAYDACCVHHTRRQAARPALPLRI